MEKTVTIHIHTLDRTAYESFHLSRSESKEVLEYIENYGLLTEALENCAPWVFAEGIQLAIIAEEGFDDEEEEEFEKGYYELSYTVSEYEDDDYEGYSLRREGA